MLKHIFLPTLHWKQGVKHILSYKGPSHVVFNKGVVGSLWELSGTRKQPLSSTRLIHSQLVFELEALHMQTMNSQVLVSPRKKLLEPTHPSKKKTAPGAFGLPLPRSTSHPFPPPSRFRSIPPNGVRLQLRGAVQQGLALGVLEAELPVDRLEPSVTGQIRVKALWAVENGIHGSVIQPRLKASQRLTPPPKKNRGRNYLYHRSGWKKNLDPTTLLCCNLIACGLHERPWNYLSAVCQITGWDFRSIGPEHPSRALQKGGGHENSKWLVVRGWR